MRRKALTAHVALRLHEAHLRCALPAVQLVGVHHCERQDPVLGALVHRVLRRQAELAQRRLLHLTPHRERRLEGEHRDVVQEARRDVDGAADVQAVVLQLAIQVCLTLVRLHVLAVRVVLTERFVFFATPLFAAATHLAPLMPL